jgi:hypothetical protein
MNFLLKIQYPKAYGTLLITTLGVLCTLAMPLAAQDSRNSRARIMSCESTNFRRTSCDADTSSGVSLVRQLGDDKCVQGSTWGFTERGIWVDRGCRAEFALYYRAPGGNWDNDRRRFTRLDPGTVIPIRTNQYINSERSDGRIYTGAVTHDIVDDSGRLAIPRGSTAELTVRVARDNDLILDLESVTVNGQRYAIRADADRVQSKDSVGANRRTGEYVGGGAILGTIVGAIAGGGKGAAIGAAAGAAGGAGAEIVTSGRVVRIPAESVLTFRLERPLEMGVPDSGSDRDGVHYHRDR